MKNTRLRLTGGFTLIELLVVVLIIGVLTAVALPQYEQAVMKSRLGQVMSTTRGLKEAMELYRVANGAYPTNGTEDLFDSLDITPNGCQNYNSRYPEDKTLWSCPGDMYFDILDHTNLTVAGWWGKDSLNDAKIGYAIFLDVSPHPGLHVCLANPTNEMALRTCRSMGERQVTDIAFVYGDKRTVGYIIER